MLLLNIISGRPHQTQINLKIKQYSAKLGTFTNKPILGACQDIYNSEKVECLIQKQLSLMDNLD